MGYQVNNYRGSVVAEIPQGGIDTTSTSLKLLGRGYVNYGEVVAENFINLIENFARESSPNAPMEGQVWYNTADQTLKVYSNLEWITLCNIFKGIGDPIINEIQPVQLTLYWDELASKLYGWNLTNTKWVEIGPAIEQWEGSTAGIYYPVSVTKIDNVRIAVFSLGNDRGQSFTPSGKTSTSTSIDSTISADFPIVYPGLTFSQNATMYNSINSGDVIAIGPYGGSSTSQYDLGKLNKIWRNIFVGVTNSGNVIPLDVDIITSISPHTLGTSSNVWGNLFVDDVNAGTIVPRVIDRNGFGINCDVGSSSRIWGNLFVNNINSGNHIPLSTTTYDLGSINNIWKNIFCQNYHTGNIFPLSAGYDIGQSDNPYNRIFANHGYFDKINVNNISSGNISYPTTDGTSNQVLTTNGSGQLFWSSISIQYLGTGVNQYVGNSGNTLQLKSLQAGTNMSLDPQGNQVVINTSADIKVTTLEASGTISSTNANISGVLTVDGSADIHSFRDIIPYDNNRFTIGTSDLRWATAYIRNIDIAGTFYCADIIPNNNTSTCGSSSSKWETIYTKIINADVGNFTNTGNLIPLTQPPDSYDLGASTTRWNHLYVNHLDCKNEMTSGNHYPQADNTYDIGSTINKWKNAYINNVYVATLTGGDITGNIMGATYGDLAEKYEADEIMEPGDVVEIGGEKEITKTKTRMSMNVFGVISEKPGFRLNSNAGTDEEYPYVAFSGRIPCKVIGQVKKGQRLISSSIPGIAEAITKITEKNIFAVIGRALQDKNDDELGLVEIVVGTK